MIESGEGNSLNWWPRFGDEGWCPPGVSGPSSGMTRQRDLMSGHGRPSRECPLLPWRFLRVWEERKMIRVMIEGY